MLTSYAYSLAFDPDDDGKLFHYRVRAAARPLTLASGNLSGLGTCRVPVRGTRGAGIKVAARCSHRIARVSSNTKNKP